jgi:hypothetical protein
MLKKKNSETWKSSANWRLVLESQDPKCKHLTVLVRRNERRFINIKKFLAFSPRELYRPSDTRLSAKLVSTFSDRGCCVVSTTDSYGRILDFLDRRRYFFFQVAPQLYSWGWVGPVSDPLLLRKSGSAGNRTRDLWTWRQELWPLGHIGGHHWYCSCWFLLPFYKPCSLPCSVPIMYLPYVLYFPLLHIVLTKFCGFFPPFPPTACHKSYFLSVTWTITNTVSFIVEDVERWIVCTPLSVNVFVTLVTE